MLASVGTASSRHSQGFGQCYAPQVPKGFSVRVFKGRAFSQPPTAKFSHGYHVDPVADSRRSQNWYPSRTTLTSTPAPGEPRHRSQTDEDSSSHTKRQVGGYESNPTYSIHQGSKDTYVYEPSLSSNTSTAAFSPCSAFSPAMSTDSIMTPRGAVTPDISLPELCPTTHTTPTSSRNSFAMMHLPGLAQAQSAIWGIFRTQAPHEAKPSRADTPYAPHAPSARSTPLPASSTPVIGRSTMPIRLSTTTSGSEDRHEGNLTNISAERSSHYTPVQSPVSDFGHSELDRVARANAEFNAVASASSSAFYSALDSVNFATSSGIANGVGDSTRRIYSDIPLRSSPEQQHTCPEVTSSYQASGRPSKAARANNDRDSYYPYAPSTEDTLTTQSEEDLASRHRQIPSDQHASEVPQFPSRYVAASRTMLPNGEPTPLSDIEAEAVAAAREVGRRHAKERPAPLPPVDHDQWGQPRERRTSLPRAPASIYSSEETTNLQSGEVHQSSLDREPPSSGRNRVPDSSREYSATGEALATVRSLDDRPRVPSLRTSPEQMYRPASSHPDAHPHEYSPAPFSAETNSNSSTTQQISVLATMQAHSHGPSSEEMYRRAPSHPERVRRDYLPEPFTTTGNYVNAAETRPPNSSHSRALSIRPFAEPTHRPSDYDATARDYGSLPSSTDTPFNYVGASATRRPSTSQALSLRTHPDQMHRLPPTYLKAPLTQDHNIPSSGTAGPLRSPPAKQSGAPLPSTSRRGLIVRPVHSHFDASASTKPISASPSNRPHHDFRNKNMSESRRPASDPHGRRSHNQLDRQSSEDRPNCYGESNGSNEYDHRLVDGSSYRVLPSSQPASTPAPHRYASMPNAPPPRVRHDSEPSPFGHIPNKDSFAPPSVSSDPGPAQAGQERRPTSPARATVDPVTSTSARFETTSTFGPVTASADFTRLRAPFPESCRSPSEPQRIRSDGDQPLHSAYAMTYQLAPQVEPQRHPQWRYYDGDQRPSNVAESTSLALYRTVRWNETLVCPSPIFAHQRRKGWFNRRGQDIHFIL
ncbi:hypothetical protein DXG03_007959 [Asterophora parasitica]|uniref:Uncharacterized protein n=1 Tax=Asterophora parasitica TaxID=117018 RepID=A0A9P7FYW6_9AGAR|nr:hypothetical protein DXG03_007959 [Asterophora parasitica]